MKALLFSPAAESDIEAIWDYSADNWGVDRADRYTDDVRDICRALADGTLRGRVVDVRAGYLKRRSGSHVVYFRDHGDHIEIVRILHGRQDVERYL